jgi:hypothetical protein
MLWYIPHKPSALRVETACSHQTLVANNQTTWSNNPVNLYFFLVSFLYISFMHPLIRSLSFLVYFPSFCAIPCINLICFLCRIYFRSNPLQCKSYSIFACSRYPQINTDAPFVVASCSFFSSPRHGQSTV